MRLQGRVALVTGGGRGIGRTICLRLAREGADVVVSGIVPSELTETADAVRSEGRRAIAVVADVTQEEQIRELIEGTRRELGAVSILVNNAAIIGPTAPAARVTRAEWDEVLAVNLTGALLCAQAVLPDMIERRAGKIINLASIAGKIAYPLRSPYAVSKWGLIGLTATLAQEVGEYGIQVNAVCPGPVEGDRMMRIIRVRAEQLATTPEAVERDYIAPTALQRMVKADDVAALVAFLASPEADNLTGQAIDVSAGYRL
jgi:NAD(P)-dependent dehydrogenase (short-subunit alcohol dehydrogenase family)